MSNIVAKYDYRRPDGTVAYTINRTKDKQFYPLTDTGLKSLDSVTRYPYNLPSILKASSDDILVLVEGEKSCDLLIELGFLATCSAGGSKWVWPREWREYFKGISRVVVIADNDDIGRECAKRRARFLKTVVADVRYLDLSDVVGEKEDVYDYIKVYGRSVDDLWKLLEYAPQIKMVDPKVHVDVEKNILAYILMEGVENSRIFRSLQPSDFMSPIWASFYMSARKLASVGLKADVPALAARSIRDGLKVSQKDAEKHLWDLYNETWDFSTLDVWLDTQLDNATRKTIEDATLNIRTLLSEGVSGGELAAAWDATPIRRAATIVQEAPTLHDFADLVEETDWLLPNFLERRDRFMIIAGEGHGKAVFLRQVAVKAAAGIHQWDDTKRVDPVRVLIIDRENSHNQIGRSVKKALDMATKIVGNKNWSDNIRIAAESSSINIVEPEHRAWLESQIVANRPDIVFLMPIYKLFEDNSSQSMERNAQEFTKVVDDLRMRYDVAIAMEHHAPKGGGDDQSSRAMVPFGSSVFQRWQELGWSFRPDGNGTKRFTVGNFRNNRGETNYNLADARKHNTIYQPKIAYWGGPNSWQWMFADV